MVVIGITLDWDDSPTYSKSYPWYALRCNYAEVISNNGAVPVMIPYDFESIENYTNIIDALLIPGGDYDLDPAVYGEETQEVTRNLRNLRSDFEMTLIKSMIKQNKPILGICAGQQLLAAMHGGKLLQDIKTHIPNAMEHEQRNLDIVMDKPSHTIKIVKDSLLYKIIGQEEIEVNSSHHQAVKSVGEGMIISAVAPDGVVEAIESSNYRFMLGVEWHPEYETSIFDQKIIRYFIETAKKNEK